MDQSTGFWLIVVLAFVFVGWSIAGGLWQRGMRAAYVRKLGETARLLSESRTMPRIRWIGQAGFQLTVDDAVAPYTKLSIVTLLMPRESILLWLAALVRRRGDRIVVRADLRERPRETSTASPERPLTELSYSRESPNLIAALEGGWVRANESAEVVAAVRKAASGAR